MRFDSNPADATKAGSFSDDQLIKQKDLEFDIPYRFRVLPIVIPVKKVMYPCIVPDKETGGTKSSWRSIRLPHDYAPMKWKKEATVFDFIEEIDLKIRRDRAVGSTEEVKGFFNIQSIWAFPVIDRRDELAGKEVEIKYFEAGWNILKGIEEIQNGLDSDDQKKLAHGPIWVHDIVIRKRKKKENSRAKDWMNTKYTVESYKENRFAGKIDSTIIDNSSQQEELFNIAVQSSIFTEAEKTLLDKFGDGELMMPLYAPMSSQDITKLLTECPIDLMALGRDNSPLFPDQIEFAEQLAKKELAYMAQTTGMQSGAGLLEPPQAPPEAPPQASPAASAPEPELNPDDEVKAPPVKDPAAKKAKNPLPSFMNELDD